LEADVFEGERDAAAAGAAGERDAAATEATAAGLRAEGIDRQTLARKGAPVRHEQFERVVRMVWRLRQPDGCPWDRAQTHGSIARDLVGEAYEALDAIVEGDDAHLCEELGDLLEQILLQAQIAADEGSFDVDDVCRGLDEKLIRRHPHVFGPAPAAGGGAVEATDAAGAAAPAAGSAGEVEGIWDEVKRAERAAAGEGGEPDGLLDSIPRSLPALMQAQKISKRAAKAGFDWPDVSGVWDKVAEERAEFEAEEPGSEEASEEFGDLLFALVNVARMQHVDAEEALERSNRKFRRRWARMEELAREGGEELEGLPTARLNELWDAVKAEERRGPRRA
jgi:tetrapyrrole methylase family protein/MazG family protein